MPKKIELNDIESIDILKNEIADYVIDEYCKTNTCPYRTKCSTEGVECKFNKSIERVIKLIHRKNRNITKLNKEIGEK